MLRMPENIKLIIISIYNGLDEIYLICCITEMGLDIIDPSLLSSIWWFLIIDMMVDDMYEYLNISHTMIDVFMISAFEISNC